MYYTSSWSVFKLTWSVVIGTYCICSCKSNYQTITATHILNINFIKTYEKINVLKATKQDISLNHIIKKDQINMNHCKFSDKVECWHQRQVNNLYSRLKTIIRWHFKYFIRFKLGLNHVFKFKNIWPISKSTFHTSIK